MSPLQRVAAFFSSPVLAFAVVAFMAMGGWAMFANAMHGLDVGARAALVQGVLSAALVAALKPALKALSLGSGKVALIAPPLIVSALYVAALILCHVLIGTRAIGLTIAAPALFALAASLFANWRMRRRSN